MKLQIKVNDEGIVKTRASDYGCGSAIASSSLVTEWVKGNSTKRRIKNTDIADELVFAAAENSLLWPLAEGD